MAASFESSECQVDCCGNLKNFRRSYLREIGHSEKLLENKRGDEADPNLLKIPAT